MSQQESPAVVKPRSNWGPGQWCAIGAAIMWYGNERPWYFLGTLPGASGLRMLYIFINLGLAVRAGHDALHYILKAVLALDEERKLQAMTPEEAAKEILWKKATDAEWNNVYQRTGEDAEKWAMVDPLKSESEPQ